VATGNFENFIGWTLALFTLSICAALLVFLGVIWLKLMTQALIILRVSEKVYRWLR
jgi:hypothetical protein